MVVGLAAGRRRCSVMTKRIVQDLAGADQMKEAVEYFCGEES